MKRKTIYEIANSTTELGVTLPINAIVQNIDTKEVFSLNEKALSTDTLDDLDKTSFGGESTQYPVIYANSDFLSEGDGSYEKPYKTLSNLVSSVEPVYDTENAALVSGSNILTLDTTSIDLKKGDKIISSYLPYNTYVTDFNATTITVSNAATSTGTYSIFFMREYLVKAFGTFNIDASIEKDGLFWDFTGATLIVGNATAFNITTVKNSDFVVRGGKWLGVHANSKLIESTYNNSSYLSINIKNIKAKSINTGYFIDLYSAAGGVMVAKNLNIANSEIDCINGYAIRTKAVNNYYYDSYIYGLLGGVNYTDNETAYANSYMSGYIGSHQDNYALICKGISALIYSTIDGRLNIQGTYRCSVFGEMKGNVLYIGKNQYSGHKVYSHLANQSLTIYVAGNAFIESAQICTINHTSGKLVVNSWSGTYNGSGGSSIFYNSFRDDFTVNLTLTSTCQCEIKGNMNCINSVLSIAAGTKLTISGFYKAQRSSVAGDLIVNKGGVFYDDKNSGSTSTITGRYYIYGTVRMLRSYGSEVNFSVAPRIPITTGTVYVDGGRVECLLGDAKCALIEKLGDGGKLIIKNADLRTANGLSPIAIRANTTTTQDVVIDHVNTNSDGTTQGLLIAFSDTTYGTTYTPNPIILNLLNEDTTYDW